MSSKSRARPAPAPEPDVEPAPGWRDRVRDAMETPGRPGLSKLVGLILEDKERAEHPAAPPTALDPEPQAPVGSKISGLESLREPTAYERAILSGMALRPMYGGTVDPETVRHRRRRNKAARIARRINRKVSR